MSNNIEEKANPRLVPGSAKGSETAIACACGVLLFVMAVIVAVFSGSSRVDAALELASGKAVLVVWGLCAISFMGLSIWANGMEQDGVSTASDMGIVQMLGWIVLVIGIIASFFFGI